MAALVTRRSRKTELLKTVPLFAGLSQRQLDLVARAADEVERDAGSVLVRQGQPGESFMLVLEGSARVERGGKQIGRLSTGEFFGEMALIDRKPRSATVVAETPVTVLLIDGRRFLGLLEQVPAMNRRILAELSARIRRLDELLVD